MEPESFFIHQRKPITVSDLPTLEDIAGTLLQATTGLFPDGHGDDTPKRFVAMLEEMTQCANLHADIDHLDTCIKWKSFENDGVDELITMANIPFVSVCNHHVIPFVGRAHISYVPDKYIVGLSKLPRVVRHYARQLQVQERLTTQIADYLQTHLEPKGVVVMLQAEHMCMTIRGVQAPGTITTTTKTLGVFADHSRTAKAEFLDTVRSSRND